MSCPIKFKKVANGLSNMNGLTIINSKDAKKLVRNSTLTAIMATITASVAIVTSAIFIELKALEIRDTTAQLFSKENEKSEAEEEEQK